MNDVGGALQGRAGANSFAPEGESERGTVNVLRALAMDAVEKANSGHPGMPMGMAEIAEVPWRRHLKHNPLNPGWANRDRLPRPGIEDQARASGEHGETVCNQEALTPAHASRRPAARAPRPSRGLRFDGPRRDRWAGAS
jgi:hypothetical protein